MFGRSGEDVSVVPLLTDLDVWKLLGSKTVLHEELMWVLWAKSQSMFNQKTFWTFLSCSICSSYSPGAESTADNAGGPHRPSQSLPVPLGPMDATLPPPPVMETGEAGPPGKMTATSKLPKGVDGSMMPVKGFAGAPGEQFTHGQF